MRDRGASAPQRRVKQEPRIRELVHAGVVGSAEVNDTRFDRADQPCSVDEVGKPDDGLVLRETNCCGSCVSSVRRTNSSSAVLVNFESLEARRLRSRERHHSR